MLFRSPRRAPVPVCAQDELRDPVGENTSPVGRPERVGRAELLNGPELNTLLPVLPVVLGLVAEEGPGVGARLV